MDSQLHLSKLREEIWDSTKQWYNLDHGNIFDNVEKFREIRFFIISALQRSDSFELPDSIYAKQ